MPDLPVEQSSTLTGVQKSAILLLALGEELAANVIKLLSDDDMHAIGYAITTIDGITRDLLEEVLDIFLEVYPQQTNVGIGVDAFIKEVLVNALGPVKASALLDQILGGAKTKGLEGLKSTAPRVLADIIIGEHPQVIATILAYLPPHQAADILGFLPADLRAEIVVRMATLENIPMNALTELNNVLEQKMGGMGTSQAKAGGIKFAAEVLNNVDRELEKELVQQLDMIDPVLSKKIQDNMFIFDDLAYLDDRSMQRLVREVQSETLLYALKLADESLKAKIFKNLSRRASQLLQEDLEVMGPVRLSEVEAAQQEILNIARSLSEKGEITLPNKGGQEYV
jgi:flagellar motor switch protein FliG